MQSYFCSNNYIEQIREVIMGSWLLRISHYYQNWLEYCQTHDNDSNQMIDTSVPTWGVTLKGKYFYPLQCIIHVVSIHRTSESPEKQLVTKISCLRWKSLGHHFLWCVFKFSFIFTKQPRSSLEPFRMYKTWKRIEASINWQEPLNVFLLLTNHKETSVKKTCLA